MTERRFLRLREQEGGCDYTIGCGQAWDFFKLDTDKTSLEQYVLEKALDNYGDDAIFAHRDLTGEGKEVSTIYEIQPTDFNWAKVMDQIKKMADEEKAADERARDEAELERLKKKLGK